MEIRFYYLLVLVLSFFIFNSAKAANQLDIVINEICWMGTQISYNDEWIELYNNTNGHVNLDGWILKTNDGTPEINLSGKIPPQGFFILERTDDNTLPNISADQIYTGALRNSGENIELYDNSGKSIDSVKCSSGWLAGENKTKRTMERKNQSVTGFAPDNWQTSANPGGTPKNQNSIGEQSETPNQSQVQSISQKEEKTQQKSTTYPTDVFINEILPSPEGADAEEEWIELSNDNDFEVDLARWEIKDIEGKTKTYIFPENTGIPANGFFVLKRPTSKITLNNDGDGLNLIRPDKGIVDGTSYDKAPEGQSFNKTDSGWTWSTNLTPGSPNAIPTKEQNKANQGLANGKVQAAVSEQLSEKIPLSPALIASGIAIFSGLVILILKKKIQPEANKE